MTRRLWIGLAVVGLLALGGAAFAVGSALREPAVVRPSATPVAAASATSAGMTRLEVCGTLLALNVTSSKALLDHAQDRAAHRKATGDPDNLQAIADALGRLQERGPSEMAVPIITIQSAMLQIAMEALGGQAATYTQQDTSEAYAKLRSLCST